jgi:predicted CXXCH cytochrome family protein
MKKSMFRFFAVGTALGIALDFPLAVRAQNESEAVHKAKCGSCHGAHGSGSPMGKNVGERALQYHHQRQEQDAAYGKSLKEETFRDL